MKKNKCRLCLKHTENPKFCSRSCSASFNNKKFPKRIRSKKRYFCLMCNEKIISFGNLFCSNDCNISYKNLKMEQKILNNEIVSHRVMRKYLIKRDGPICCLCGWSKINPNTKKVPIELDHIDGHSENTILSNMRLICPNCSSLQSTYKALNIGNGNPNRRRFYNGKIYGKFAPVSPVASNHLKE